MASLEQKWNFHSALRVAMWFALGAIVFPAAVFVYLVSGYAPAATADHPFQLESQFAKLALRVRISRDAPSRDVSRMTATDLLAGADTYAKRCAMCHGLPNQPAPAIADRMFPKAPQLMGLLQSGGASKPDGNFWKVKNGIRLTGMPSYQNMLTDDQIWQVVELLANRRNLPPEVKDALASENASPLKPADSLPANDSR